MPTQDSFLNKYTILYRSIPLFHIPYQELKWALALYNLYNAKA